MQALEWAVMGDGFVKNAIVIGCGHNMMRGKLL